MNNKIQVLFLTKFIPLPKDSGGKIGTYNLLAYLSKHYIVDFVSFYENKIDEKYLKDFSTLCRSTKVIFKRISINENYLKNVFYFLRSLINNKPYFIDKFSSRLMRNYLLKNIKNKYDLIIVDGLNMFQYSALLKGKIILQEHNIEHQIIERYYKEVNFFPKKILLFYDYMKLKRYEINSIKETSATFFVSQYNKDIILKEGINTKNLFVTTFPADTKDIIPIKSPYKFIDHLYTIGSLLYPPNLEGLIWFDRTILPIIKKTNPHVRVFHIGYFTDAIKRQLSSSIELLGYVDDINKYMNSNIIHIIPLHCGGGIRIKILNSLAASIPMVATEMAAEGINVEDGKNISLANTPEDFAKKTIELLTNPEKRALYIKNMPTLLKKYYSIEAYEKTLDEIFKKVL